MITFPDAPCARTDPEIFHPEKGGSNRDAKQICGGCEHKAACLAVAMADPSLMGIWAGTTEQERKRMRRQERNAA